MTPALIDFIVNELVYLLSVTDEAAPWAPWAKIMPKHRNKHSAHTGGFAHSIEQCSQNPLKMLITGSLVQTEDGPQDHTERNLLHGVAYRERLPGGLLAYNLF